MFQKLAEVGHSSTKEPTDVGGGLGAGPGGGGQPEDAAAEVISSVSYFLLAESVYGIFACQNRSPAPLFRVSGEPPA